jgi:glycosyltransferase involved in cell wall biosynthesis
MTFRVVGHTHAYAPANNAGGPATMHALLKAGQRLRGWDVSVILDAAPNDAYEWDGIPVLQTRSVPKMREKYRIASAVITHLNASKRAVALAGRTKPLVHLVHNHRQLYVYQVEPQENYLALFNSIWMDRNTAWDGHRAVLHPIVDPEDYRVKPKGDAVVLVNRTTSKGVELFYELVEANPDFRFIAVRGGYGEQVSVPKMYPNLTEMNNVSNPREIYRQARVMLMPSLYESWGRVAIEAAISGIPTIGSKTHGLLESGVCAGYFESNDIAGWNAGLRSIMTDQAVWDLSSEHALRRVEEVQRLNAIETDRALDLIEAMSLTSAK